MRHARTTLAALVAMSLVAAPAAGRKRASPEASDTPDVPIVIGGPTATAACPVGGEVVGLDPQGDDFLSVRGGPGGRDARESDRIHTGQQVKICDMSGPWFGVVYDPGGPTDLCDVDRPWPVRRDYAGRCRQGWVYSRYVDVKAR